MNQQSYNLLLNYFHRYNDNLDYLKSHDSSDRHYADCEREVRAVKITLLNIEEKDKLAMCIIKEVFIDGEKFSLVAKRHHKSLGEVVKRSSWALVNESSINIKYL